MLRLIPVIAEAMAMTTVTPIATPRTVRAARTLLDRSESSATPTPSAIRESARPQGRASFRPQRENRVEARGAARRIHTSRDSDRDAEDDPDRMDHGATAAGSGVTCLTIQASASPNPIPASAPARESAADSTTNCARMSPRRAPRAFRMPISRVRSLTAISMMFMMTMPPTTSEIATKPGNARKRTREIFFHVPSAPSAV